LTLTRHFTATGFVVHDGSVALHFHRKLRLWLPPGGHIEANEDPVQAVQREIAEETGLAAQVVPTSTALGLPYPTQVHAPYTILVEDIDDPLQGFHQHIDMIYFCRPNTSDPDLGDGWVWASRDELANGSALTIEGVSPQAPPEDVRVLGQKAIEFVGGASQSP
jgi:8-oxo-dGTP pyrophosphatase MutT (NUDIX family)